MCCGPAGLNGPRFVLVPLKEVSPDCSWHMRLVQIPPRRCLGGNICCLPQLCSLGKRGGNALPASSVKRAVILILLRSVSQIPLLRASSRMFLFSLLASSDGSGRSQKAVLRSQARTFFMAASGGTFGKGA